MNPITFRDCARNLMNYGNCARKVVVESNWVTIRAELCPKVGCGEKLGNNSNIIVPESWLWREIE
jgi:hypothetical protein